MTPTDAAELDESLAEEAAERKLVHEAERFFGRLYVIAGIASGIAGVLLLMYPAASLEVLLVLLGIDLAIVSGRRFVAAAAAVLDPGACVGQILLAALALTASFLVLRDPATAGAGLVLLLAVGLIVAGTLVLGRGVLEHVALVAASARGVALIAGGTAMIAVPVRPTTVALLAGIALLVLAVVELVMAQVGSLVPVGPRG